MYSRKSPPFVELEGSLQCWQEPGIGPYRDQNESSPQLPTLFLPDHIYALVFQVVTFLQASRQKFCAICIYNVLD
jgi:hypothetical protein